MDLTDLSRVIQGVAAGIGFIGRCQLVEEDVQRRHRSVQLIEDVSSHSHLADLFRTIAPAPFPVGYGSGRASCVTNTGQSDFAKTACVVDVHWRGGPIKRTSTFVVSAALTISVAGTPDLTTTSTLHHSFASGGMAASTSA